ncbi:unnamed protein product [Paramecium pentaurelia]|uniref:Mitochondrial import inner membrane translocase subunit TIM50 n=1 Tax=Paramecium pentaurelia TaxID=43138 RepID=A0A8S1VY27_9CILI|nr:unnamed protein product [Paramecium pentaurelia]
MFGYILAWLCQFIDKTITLIRKRLRPKTRLELRRYHQIPRTNSFYTGKLRLLIGLEGTLVCTSYTSIPGWDKINIKYLSGVTQDFYVKHRPYLDEFLLSHLYNPNIRFCNSNNKSILHKIKAQFLQIKSCVISRNKIRKEINMTTSNPHNVIFVDYDEDQCLANSENAYPIIQYNGQDNDIELLKLKDFLIQAEAQMRVRKEHDPGVTIQDILQEMTAED